MKNTISIAALLVSLVVFSLPLFVSAQVVTGSLNFGSNEVSIFDLTAAGGSRGGGSGAVYYGTYPNGTLYFPLSSGQVFMGNASTTWGASGVNLWTSNFTCTVPSSSEADCPTSYTGLPITYITDFQTAFGTTTSPAAGNYYMLLYDANYAPTGEYFPFYWTGFVPMVSSQIDFSQYYTPTVFSTTSAAIAASSSLWGAYASTSQLTDTCTTGNVFGDALCSAVAFLFVPNPNVVSGFTMIPTVAGTRFPFSWIYGVQAEFSSLSASSTKNMSTLSINFADLDIGSSTPMGSILPNVTVFSTTTVTQYIGLTTWQYFQDWIGFTLWLGLIADIFFLAKRLASHHV